MRNEDELIPSIMNREEPSIAHKRNWARLIQKIYEVDPLTCTKCRGRMRIIAFIEEPEIVKKILKHLGTLGSKPAILTAGKSQTTTQSEFATNESRISYRLYGFSTSGV